MKPTFLNFSQAYYTVDGVGGGTIGSDGFYLICNVGDQMRRELKTLISLDFWGCVEGD